MTASYMLDITKGAFDSKRWLSGIPAHQSRTARARWSARVVASTAHAVALDRPPPVAEDGLQRRGETLDALTRTAKSLVRRRNVC